MKGIDLTQLKVNMGRPRGQNVRSFIKSLPLGKGFTLSDLSEESGYSEATIEKAAQGLKCLRYVEMLDGSSVRLVMNPATAAEKTRR